MTAASEQSPPSLSLHPLIDLCKRRSLASPQEIQRLASSQRVARTTLARLVGRGRMPSSEFFRAKGVNPITLCGLALRFGHVRIASECSGRNWTRRRSIGRGECEQLRRACGTKKHWASKAKVTAAVTVKGVETLMTTTRTSAKEAG